MAGILPIAFHNGKIYFLYGRETKDYKSKDSGKWSDFGGAREKNESLKTTAIREGFEETMGIFGDEKSIRNLVNNKLVVKLTINNYTTYIVEVSYDKNIPKKYNKMYKHIKKEKYYLIQEHNGLWEKDKMTWVELKNLKQFRNYARPWYKYVMSATMNYFKNFNKTE